VSEAERRERVARQGSATGAQPSEQSSTVSDAERRERVARQGSALLVALLVIGALLAACTVGPSRRPPLATSGPPRPAAPATTAATTSVMPIGPGGPGQQAGPIAWTACPAGLSGTGADSTRFTVDCGALRVPASYANRSLGSLTVQVARARAQGLPADAPPLVVILGSPGESGTADIAAVATGLPAAITQRFAVVMVDLRGTGSSNGFDCVSDSDARAIIGLAADPATPAGQQQIEAIARQLTFDCGDLVGPPLTQFNSTNAADDLDSLRAGLGVGSLTVVAQGYGATLGAVYADRYPGRVREMVLDAPDDPLSQPSDRTTAQAKAAETLLDDFAASCPSFPGGCPLGSQPRAEISSLVSGLATTGKRAGEWTITGGSVLLALLATLPDQARWPSLASAIASLRDGQPQPLADLLVGRLGGSQLSERLTGRILFSCNDNAQRVSLTDMASAVATAKAAAPLFGPIGVSLAALCGAWPAPDAVIGAVKAAGARPIVVLGAVKSSTHPYVGVQSVAGQLSSAVLVSWQSGADASYPASPCVATIVNTYLLTSTMPAVGTLCPP
jgi:pimeloyl-ACP methyl ester carboxylesterase